MKDNARKDVDTENILVVLDAYFGLAEQLCSGYLFPGCG